MIPAGPAVAHAPTPPVELRLPQGGRLTVGGDRRALVMGILNVTPDSFSDGGLFFDEGAAIARGEQLLAEGADLLDVGGESTRPGADPVPPDVQIERIVPVIEALARHTSCVPISVDTTSADVAERALDAGASIVNDVSALRDDPRMACLVARRKAPVILMHMLGRPRTMQIQPHYDDVVAEVRGFLAERIAAAVDAGIDPAQIVIDPGFGFGKLFEHNMELLRRLDALRDLNRPILAGTSRKAMLGHILGVPPMERVYGTLASVTAAVERGAAIVRVHEVKPAVHAVKVLAAIHGRSWQ